MRTILIAVLGLLATAAPARGDGGVVQHVEVVDALRVTAFSAPTPLRAGPVDVSFLVQDVASGEAVMDAEIEVALRLEPSGMGPPRTVVGRATRGDATNRLLYAALLELPTPGDWEVSASISTGDRRCGVTFPIAVGPPQAPWVRYWPWLGLPVVGLALFAAHQVLTLRAAARVTACAGSPTGRGRSA